MSPKEHSEHTATLSRSWPETSNQAWSHCGALYHGYSRSQSKSFPSATPQALGSASPGCLPHHLLRTASTKFCTCVGSSTGSDTEPRTKGRWRYFGVLLACPVPHLRFNARIAATAGAAEIVRGVNSDHVDSGWLLLCDLSRFFWVSSLMY